MKTISYTHRMLDVTRKKRLRKEHVIRQLDEWQGILRQRRAQCAQGLIREVDVNVVKRYVDTLIERLDKYS